jgi:FkbH-like protein
MDKIKNLLRRIKETPPRNRTYSDYLELSNLAKEDSSKLQFPVLKISILRNFTVEPLLPILEGEILLAGFLPQVWMSDFDTISSDVFRGNDSLDSFSPDFILLLNWLETLSPILSTQFLSQPKENIANEVMRVRQWYRDIETQVRKKFTSPIIINNFPLPNDVTLGILDSQDTQYHLHTIQSLNESILLDSKEIGDIYVMDVARIFAAEGFFNCFNARHWQIARAPLSQIALLRFGYELGKFVRALRGRTKKCLVLDCDNTLWGGVIGEDGINGIQLGTTFPGSSYKSLQEEILNLRERGVILALCSKNNERDVFQVLNAHPEMLIKQKHLAAWQVNWDDKAINLKRLAEELNIGLDSFVFVDDSDFEVNWVREQLPEVSVIHLRGNTSDYRSLLSSFGYFDALTFTFEDRRKNDMYSEAKVRRQLELSSSSMEDYLINLGLEARVGVPSPSDIARCSQLTQKTNQFNLTNIRYSEGQIKELVDSFSADVFCLRVKDKVADLGLVGVAVVRYEGQVATIESLMMSCRAIGRGAETALLSYIAERALEIHDVKILLAGYVHTLKNETLVSTFYKKHNFDMVSQSEKDTNWSFDLKANKLEYPTWIKIIKL